MSKEFEQAFKKITGVAPADGAGCNNPDQPCEWLAEELYEAGKAAGRALGRREAAKIIRDENARVLATQSGKLDYTNYAIDTNIRMIAMLLPDLADAIEAIPEEA